jgi:hypothetical protein
MDTIRREFGQAFARWPQQHYREPGEVEGREVAGTAESMRFLQSDFPHKTRRYRVGHSAWRRAKAVAAAGWPAAGVALRSARRNPRRHSAGINGVEVRDPGHLWLGAEEGSETVTLSNPIERPATFPPRQARAWELRF